MKTIRGVFATLAFALGFFVAAGGVAYAIAAMASQILRKYVETSVEDILRAGIPGAVVAVIGLMFLFGARALDGTRGPVLRLRKLTPHQQMELRRKEQERQRAHSQ